MDEQRSILIKQFELISKEITEISSKLENVKASKEKSM